MRSARNGYCSVRLKGNARSTSCASALGTSGVEPVSSASRASAVATSPGAGERGPSPAISRRGGFREPMESSTMTATTWSDCGELWASLRAPSSPYAPASVETNDSVCVGLTPPTAVRVLEYARASSMSAAVPEALSFAPECPRVESRCATTRIVSRERPGTTALTFRRSTRPRPATSAGKRSIRVLSPSFVSSAATQRAAPPDAGEPGERSG